MNTPSFIQERCGEIHRMVVKVGTHLLRSESGGLNLDMMNRLVGQIAALRKKGIQVILVSSGAVGAGAYAMGWQHPPESITDRQALAAVGQSRLMHLYKIHFREHDITIAQVLLTRDGLDHRQRYLNIRNTLETLLKWDVVPIINENDTVSIEELKFGDNDQLSAMIAAKMDADVLALLTDVDGLYDRPPSEEGAKRIPIVSHLSETEFRAEGKGKGGFSLGGMQSKLTAVGIATQAGVLTNISYGHETDILLKVAEGQLVGTWFEPREKKLSGRKRWLAFGKRLCEGRIGVDAGAERAVREGGKSLLPSGVVSVEGTFRSGDLVRVCSSEGEEVARGLVQYSSEELENIKGMKTREICALLGKRQNYEVIHRDDMVVQDNGGGK